MLACVALLVSSWITPMGGYAAGVAYERYVDVNSGTDGASPQGESSGLGAWKTLHHAISMINALLVGTQNTCTLYVASGDYASINNGGYEVDNAMEIFSNDLAIVGALSPSRPVIDGMYAVSWSNGLQIGIVGSTASNVAIRNLVIKNFGPSGSGVEIFSGLNNIIENCEMFNNGYGVRILADSQRNEIRNGCSVHDNFAAGIYIEGSDENLIHDNIIYDNATYGSGIGIHLQSDGQSGGKSPDNNKIYHNNIYWTSGVAYSLYGIQFSQDVVGWIFEGDGNEVDQNDFHGPSENTTLHTAIRVYPGSTNTKIVNNLIHDVGTGIYLTDNGSSTTKIYHNTVADGGIAGISYLGSPEIKYNIITGFADVNAIGIEDRTPHGGSIIDYNDVWGNGIAYSGCSAGTNDISKAPLYNSGGYALVGTSPCINAIPIGDPPNDPVNDDIDGTVRPYGSGYDMGCYENTNLPAVSTTNASLITSTTASSGGYIISDGGALVDKRGVCWSTSSNPTTSDNKTMDGTGTGAFVSRITGLSPGAGYHVRAYATSSNGTGYGNEVLVTTNDYSPGAYYVDIANGDDANDGSSASPWKTAPLRHTAGQRRPGRRLRVERGRGGLQRAFNGNGEPDTEMILFQSNVTIIGAGGMNYDNQWG